MHLRDVHLTHIHPGVVCYCNRAIKTLKTSITDKVRKRLSNPALQSPFSSVRFSSLNLSTAIRTSHFGVSCEECEVWPAADLANHSVQPTTFFMKRNTFWCADVLLLFKVFSVLFFECILQCIIKHLSKAPAQNRHLLKVKSPSTLAVTES